MILLLPLQTSVTIHQEPGRVIVDNGRVRLTIDRKTGGYDVRWGGFASLVAGRGEARGSRGGLQKTSDAARHEIATGDVTDALGRGVRVVVRHLSPKTPEVRHVFWVYAGRPEAIVRLEAVGAGSSNYLAPVLGRATVAGGPLQALFVPYDNDAYDRYDSQGWDETSHEVSALYDDASRHGLVVGSIDHDVWKSGVRFERDGSLRAFGGMTGPHTRDQEPHGWVAGRTVRSPRMVLGFYEDWRTGMERFGELNALVRPALPWGGAVPFGWNSWGAHKSKVNAANMDAATLFLQHELAGFRSGGVAYVNFDSFWDNLKAEERRAFVRRAHAAGLRAGIYWTPFVNWGEPDWKVGGDARYRYRDLALKDAHGEPLPKLDGGWPLDPTHPGTLARIDRQLKEFVSDGYDYIKLDFMTHGALEGRRHDPRVSTGTQAYAVGMKRIVDDLSSARIGRPFFIGLSIAPLFPHGFAHSRRVSCDVFSNIGASEYLLNSSAYGWWTANRLYRFNDPDHTVVYQPLGEPPTTEAEARTRFLGSVVSGGMLLDSDDLGDPLARERVRRLYSNVELLDLARKAPAFRPVDGDTGRRGGDAFVWEDAGAVYVAAFNFDKDRPHTRTIPWPRLGLRSGAWKARDLWTGTERVLSDALTLSMAPMDCAIVRLQRP